MTSIDIYSLPLAYVYKITNKETGEFYIGSCAHKIARTKLTPEKHFLIKYHSSGVLKEDIILHPEKYQGIILFRSNETYVNSDNASSYIVWWYEQVLIRQHISNPLCKNGHYVDPDTSKQSFSHAGKTPWNKGKSSARKGIPLSVEHKTKISKTRTGQPGSRVGATTSEETKLKQSDAMMGKHKNRSGSIKQPTPPKRKYVLTKTRTYNQSRAVVTDDGRIFLSLGSAARAYGFKDKKAALTRIRRGIWQYVEK